MQPLAIQGKKYNPNWQDWEVQQDFCDYKRDVNSRPELTQKEKDRLIDEYIEEMGL